MLAAKAHDAFVWTLRQFRNVVMFFAQEGWILMFMMFSPAPSKLNCVSSRMPRATSMPLALESAD